ncbi:salicylate 1-hydroxylase-like protein [Penicillium lagena]|uniref:salicylate 1-hydroxylase-like protein n=1 Tax=Penicillium lagena TaxID=94218 RepID=UPI00253FE887|nr:salicylate 1-hydroxylase-like protein [Penicillium lagena]KAJ5602272.1 salicylate 1-hydroxylase-like protein [Penicillium lagena]
MTDILPDGYVSFAEASADAVSLETLGKWPAKNAQFYWGYGGHVLMFPIEHAKIMNVVAFRTKKDGKWDHGRNGHLGSIRSPPASTYYQKSRICLLGIAAHSSTLHQGSGAGIEIEDALVLSHLLADVREKSQMERAFMAYDTVGHERTQKLVTTSRDAGCFYGFQKQGVGDDVEADLEGRIHWVWDLDLQLHLAEAKKVFSS